MTIGQNELWIDSIKISAFKEAAVRITARDFTITERSRLISEGVGPLKLIDSY